MFRPPEYAALINPIACNAFAMRCEGRADIKQTVTINTGNTDGQATQDVEVMNYTTSSAVCDAKMFVLPYAELVTPVTPDYLGQFHTALFTFNIDGEKVIDDSAIQNHLLCPACLVAGQTTSSVLLIAGVSEDELLGGCQMFFLPNGTNLVANITGIPSGAGTIRVNTGAILANYTTKARQGCLFGVGALDAQNQAYPVTFPCASTFGAAMSPSTSPVPASSPTAGPAFGPANMG
jgi:hypothetical protein